MSENVAVYKPLNMTAIAGNIGVAQTTGVVKKHKCSSCTGNGTSTTTTNPYIIDAVYQNDHFVIFTYAIIPATLGITPTDTVVGAFWVDNVYHGSGLTTDPVPTTPTFFGGSRTAEILEPVLGINNLIFYTNSRFFIRRVLVNTVYTYQGVFLKFRPDITYPEFPFFYIKGRPDQVLTFNNLVTQETKLVIVSNLINNTLLTKTQTSVVLRNRNYNNVQLVGQRDNGTPIYFTVIPNSTLDVYGTVRSPKIYIVVYQSAVNLSFDDNNVPIVQGTGVSLNEILFNLISATNAVSGQSIFDVFPNRRILPEGIRFSFESYASETNSMLATFIARYIKSGNESLQFLTNLESAEETTNFIQPSTDVCLGPSTVKTSYTSDIFVSDAVVRFETTLTMGRFVYNANEPRTSDNILSINVKFEVF